MVTLTNLTTLHSVMIPTPVVSGAKRPANPVLVFAKSGQTMRLSEVWLDGAPGLLTLSKSKEASAKVAVKVN